ncbi:MAG TPA: nuclear transport factor 2 family protein [Hyphomonas sp.]|nr:nuclear transport factor 2 family protein [Hyphomonas sp.]MCB9962596.1 nuclear transport factor 2 family protein [Hyphomonas sp.]HPE47891.1 nuclear transport factor 2 family protein [Hyphomonas sp.]
MLNRATWQIVAVSVLMLAVCAHVPAARPDFAAAVENHLAAIKAKDINAFLPTISATDELDVIFPNGEVLKGHDAVADFHKEWFGDSEWRMTPVVDKLIEGKDLSTALVRYDYRDTPDGAPRSAWLVLVFRLEDGAWRLVHDQNTRIEPPEPG